MLKILIIGDSNWGKTSLVSMYSKGSFNKDEGPTIAAMHSSK